MSNKSDNLEIVHEGWLTKSPPTKRIWRARWRKRWFVLRHSGELPGQYFLCYYTDRNCRKLKGQIDLDRCEQVDAGLRFENRKQKYQHMFDVRTPKRTYYLAAETEDEMNKWVDCVCHVCGLKAYNQDENNYTDYEYNPSEDEPTSLPDESRQTADSPPVSPSSTASGPYIPIFECISGEPLSSPDGLNDFLAIQQQQNRKLNGDDFYDAPRRLQPPNLDLPVSVSTTPPLQSPATDRESVFTDEEWTNPNPKPSVNWATFPRPSDSSIEGDNQKPATITVRGKRYTRNLGDFEVPVAPPRPPKPSHLVSSENGNHSYLNLETMTSGTSSASLTTSAAPVTNGEVTNDGVNDEMYDFPRSHNLNGETEGIEKPVPQARHCYTNAAPGKVNGDVFRYDFPANQMPLSSQSEPNSPPVSDSLSAVLYSNLPSSASSLITNPAGSNHSPGMVPSPAVPPTVNRDLKPGRKMSDSASSEASPLPVPSQPPPSIDRKLKPTPAIRKKPDHHEEGVSGSPLKLLAPPLGRLGLVATDQGSLSLRRPRAAPSPTPPITRRYSDTSDSDFRGDLHDKEYYYESHRDHVGSFDGSKRLDAIQYLDLDLDTDTVPSTPPVQDTPTVVYKEVDFIKTLAFIRTRQTVEEKRKQCTDVM